MPEIRRRHVALAAVALLLSVIVVLLPLAAISYISELRSPVSRYLYPLTPALPANTDSAAVLRMEITIAELTPWDASTRMRIAGHYTCPAPCPAGLRVRILSLPLKQGPGTVPSVESISFPAATSDV